MTGGGVSSNPFYIISDNVEVVDLCSNVHRPTKIDWKLLPQVRVRGVDDAGACDDRSNLVTPFEDPIIRILVCCLMRRTRGLEPMLSNNTLDGKAMFVADVTEEGLR